DKPSEELIKWISTISFNEEHNQALDQCTPGTGTWILRSPEFNQWMTNGIRILWCPGKPGVGKTILVSTIIQHLEETFGDKQDTIVLFIYCNYKKQYSVQELMAALLRQLALHNLTYDSQALLNRLKNKQHHPSLGQLRTLLQNEVDAYSRVFMVIDALDECSDVVQKDFMEKIQSLTSVKLLVTSRLIDSI
ncbi:hypothetical protein L208DRAFT_1051913, partial [Tricholoma matsutake]